MKLIVVVVLTFPIFPMLNLASSSNTHLHQTYRPVTLDSFTPLDEWGDINFSDEKARLDNVAIYWQKQPRSIIYVVVYAGETACVGEARARGIRAKKYLLKKRRVLSDHVVWIDGGWLKEVRTTIWVGLPEGGRPPVISSEFTLKPGEVRLEKGCQIKNRTRAAP